MNTTLYKPLVEISSEIDLTQLGYENGTAVVIVNMTSPLRKALIENLKKVARATSDEEKAEALTEQYHLTSFIVRSVEVNGTEIKVNSGEDIRRIDEGLDDRILDFAVWEAIERGKAGLADARATFRAQRESTLLGRQENQNQATTPRDNRSGTDENPQ